MYKYLPFSFGTGYHIFVLSKTNKQQKKQRVQLQHLPAGANWTMRANKPTLVSVMGSSISCFLNSSLRSFSSLSPDLHPVDLLSRVLPRKGEALSGVRMVQEGGARGVQFFSPTQALTFPSSQLFINCPLFPAEFSIVATVKVSHTRMKVCL